MAMTVADVRAMLRGAKPAAQVTEVIAEPWPGYNEQNVADVLALLEGMTASQRAAVLDYERVNKARRSIIEHTWP